MSVLTFCNASFSSNVLHALSDPSASYCFQIYLRLSWRPLARAALL